MFAFFLNYRFETEYIISKILFVPKHRVYLAFCSCDLTMRVFTDAYSGLVEIGQQACPLTVLWYV